MVASVPGDDAPPSFPTLSYKDAVQAPEDFKPALQDALMNSGFFYLNDIEAVVPKWREVWDDAFTLSSEFFDQPEEVKQEIAMSRSRHFRGFSTFGSETTGGKVDLREQLDFAPETDAAVKYPPSQPDADDIQLSLYGPNQYPSRTLPSFEPAITTYKDVCERIAEVLVARMAESLSPKPELFTKLFSPPSSATPNYSRMKVVRYPPVPEGAEGLGVGAHKDGGGITLLAQDNTGGLQVQKFDGNWVNVVPEPYALVINVGQVIERASCGTYSATTHRVLPTTGRDPRISIPFFYSPSLPTVLEPLEVEDLHEELVLAARGRREVSEVKKGDLHEPVFGRAAWRGITRSHLEVWEKWYGRTLDTFGGPAQTA